MSVVVWVVCGGVWWWCVRGRGCAVAATLVAWCARLGLRGGRAPEQHDGRHDETVDGVHVVPVVGGAPASKRKVAQASASWLSHGGRFQRQSKPQAA